MTETQVLSEEESMQFPAGETADSHLRKFLEHAAQDATGNERGFCFELTSCCRRCRTRRHSSGSFTGCWLAIGSKADRLLV